MPESFGYHERAFVHSGKPDYRGVIEKELSGDYFKKSPNQQEEQEASLVTSSEYEERGDSLIIGKSVWSEGEVSWLTIAVSASEETRDKLRSITREFLKMKLKLLTLEFQP